MNTSGKTALITGGGTGIGLELAKVFMAEGATVIVCGRTLANLERAQSENPGLRIAQCDVTDNDQIQALQKRREEEFGGVDVLVNNAAVFHTFHHVHDEHPLEAQLAEVDIDVTGPLRMVHFFLPGMLKRSEASIVNVSSGLAFVPYVAAPIYSATKAASHAWTRSLRKQLAKTSVTVVELMPPVVDTALAANVEGIPKMAPDKLAAKFMRGFKKGKTEIKPGLSAMLSGMSRFAPRFIFNRLNKE